ncbi:MAG TPA: Pr6Pr family membrane protein [Candidatus Saccharimonadales bacterium]|nr:Pr6Pr family membrane protein [Candidatus Saccharimonadales bacterium]
MKKLTFIASYRLILALLGLAAVIAQFFNNAALLGKDYNPVNFFSFFTIESNLLFIAVLAIGAYMAWHGRRSKTFEMFRGAAVIYMVATGIIFSLLLTGLQEELLTHIPWVNAVLHYVLPLAALLDWLFDLPERRISFKQGLVWLVFPLSYLVYSLIRGSVVDWYPYPFLNPTLEGGWSRVTIMAIVITGVFTLLVWLATWSSSWKLAMSKKPAKR